MIPKIIHFCWFGRGARPQEFQKYLSSWKKYCPDFKIMEWNEDTFDLSCNTYVNDAYCAKKWAFVTDYVRLWAIYTYGGIYMDTDVELLQPIDVFLKDKAFSGFESIHTVPTGIMGGEAKHPVYKALLEEYTDRKFNLGNGKYNLTTNVEYITQYFQARGMRPDNSLQVIEDFTLYPKEYFCPKNPRTLKIECTKNTYAIHHFASSWVPVRTRIRKQIKKVLGPRAMEVVIRFMDRFGIK